MFLQRAHSCPSSGSFPVSHPRFQWVSLTPGVFGRLWRQSGFKWLPRRCRAALSERRGPWLPPPRAERAGSWGEEVTWRGWGRAAGTAPRHSPLPCCSSPGPGPGPGQGGFLASVPIALPRGSPLLSLLASL